jgi:probable HAF family extracellular repeat protein
MMGGGGVVSAPAGGAASFTELGHLGIGDASYATDVSADGSVVVGYSEYDTTSNHEAFRWTAATGMVALGGLGGVPLDSRAFAVSADGTVIAGEDQETFRWTEPGGLTSIGTLGNWCSGMGMSGDGNVIVGVCQIGMGRESFRWSQATGIVSIGALGVSPIDSFASDASADGTVFSGQSMMGTNFEVEAFRWTQADGMVGLGDLPGGLFYALGMGISGDGSTIVGEAISDIGWEAFRWTEAGGLQSLDPNAAAFASSFAHGVSADGAIIVGSAGHVGGACLWTERHGFVGIQDILVNEHGLDLTGWILHTAEAISDDKRTIVGYGTNPAGNLEAWVARMPAICPGDANADFEVNVADLGVVLAQFGQMGVALAGDFNGDLTVNIADLGIVLAHFGMSC